MKVWIWRREREREKKESNWDKIDSVNTTVDCGHGE